MMARKVGTASSALISPTTLVGHIGLTSVSVRDVSTQPCLPLALVPETCMSVPGIGFGARCKYAAVSAVGVCT